MDGVLVGSRPTRLYIVRTRRSTSAGGFDAHGRFGGGKRRVQSRLAVDDGGAVEPQHAGANDRGEVRRERESCHRHYSAPDRWSDVQIRLRIGRDDPANTLAELPRIGLGQRRRVDRLVDDQLHVAGIRRQPPFQHHVAAADDRNRHHRQARFERQVEAAALEARHAAVAAARALRKDDQATGRCDVRRDAQPKIFARSGRLRSTSMWPVRRRCQPRNGKLPSDSLAMIRS